jgi:alanyl-tRNA synthetase
LGYDAHDAQGKVIALVDDKGGRIETAGQGNIVSVVLNQTPFYGESGGQEGDRGTISTESGAKLSVSNTDKQLGSVHVHVAKVEEGAIVVGDVVHAHVDVARRNKLRANHSATHLLHAVLREVLGNHVTQKGSLVAEDRLRFDISHPKALSADELQVVEDKVNALVRQNTPVGTRLMTPDEAIAAGAMALFGEKYGDEVRVLNMGHDADGFDLSVELCGGTHVRHTGDIGFFKIVSEGAIAAGVRRIEAMTGQSAEYYARSQEQVVSELASTLKVTPEEVLPRFVALLEERKKLERALADARKAAAMGGGDGASIEEISGVKFIGQHFADLPPKDLRGVAGDLMKKVGSGVIAVTSSFDGKGSLIVAVSDDVTDKYDAVTLVRAGADVLGAKGAGGKPNFAQTGGPNGAAAKDALDKVKSQLAA